MDLNINRISNYISRFLGIDIEELSDHFSPANNGDFEKLIKFRESLFQKGAPWDDAEYIKWRYSFDKNSSEGNNIWIFKKNEEILGCLGIELVPMVINNKKYTAHKTMDLLVKPKLHGIGLGLWMILAAKEKFPIILVIGSNRNSYPIAEKVYKKMLPLKKYKLIFNVKPQLKKILKIDLLSNLVSFPVNLILWNYFPRSNKLPDSYSSKLLDNIPNTVNHFHNHDNKIHVLRDKNYLTWRFLNNPRRRYIILGLYKFNKLIAVSVSSIIYSRASDQKEGHIVDWLLDTPDSADTLQLYLYLETVKYLKKQNVKLIHVNTLDNKSCNTLSKLGFIPREENKPFFTGTSDEDLQKYFYNDDLWLLSEGDSDTDLF